MGKLDLLAVLKRLEKEEPAKVKMTKQGRQEGAGIQPDNSLAKTKSGEQIQSAMSDGVIFSAKGLPKCPLKGDCIHWEKKVEELRNTFKSLEAIERQPSDDSVDYSDGKACAYSYAQDVIDRIFKEPAKKKGRGK